MAPKMYRGSSDSPKRRDLGSVKRALKTQGSLLLTHKGEVFLARLTGEEGEKARRQPSVSSGTFCQSGKGQRLEISEVRMLT